MDDVNRHARHFGEGDGASGRFTFGVRRTRQRVILGRCLSLAQRFLDQLVDHAAILRMHAYQSAVFPCASQRPEDRLIVHHEHAGVRHEELEAGDALVPDHPIHVAEPGVLELGDDHVEPVIDHRLAVGALPPVVERMTHRAPAVLNREVDDAGRSAEGSRDSARLEIVRRRRAAKRHIEMGMDIDAAGNDVLARRIDRAIRLETMRRKVFPDRGDDAAIAVHIRDIVVRRRDDPAVGNEKGHINKDSFSSRRRCSRRTRPSAPCKNRSPRAPSPEARRQSPSSRRTGCGLRRRPSASSHG